jgi:hypothetical protein
MQALLVINSTIQGNKAVGNTSLPSAVQNIQNLIGAGGGVWIGGNTSGLLQGTQINGNTADTVGGGAMIHLKCPAGGGRTALVASERPWAPMFEMVRQGDKDSSGAELSIRALPLSHSFPCTHLLHAHSLSHAVAHFLL